MTKPATKLSLFAATAMVVANMIGTGVFTSVGFQIADFNSATPILTLWLCGGLLSLCGALCYAELVTMMPRSGGEYHLLREAYHPVFGFMAGWISLVAGFAAPIALAAVAFAKYAQHFGVTADPKWLASSLVIALTLVNIGGDRWTGRFLSGFTTLKVLLILAFIAGAIFLPGHTSTSLAPKPGDLDLVFSSSFAGAMIYVMYAFEGWNAATYVAGEVEDPKRNMPRALVIGTLIVTALYFGLNAVFLWRAPWADMKLKEEAGLIAAQAIFGPTGGKFMGFLIAFGLISSVAAMICAGSHVNARMGEDLPFLRWLSPRTKGGAPFVSVLVVSVLAILMIQLGTFNQVLHYVEALLLMSSCMVVLAVFWMRWRLPNAERPFKVPLYPITPLLFAVIIIYMLKVSWTTRKLEETLTGVGTLVVGLIVYFVGPLFVKQK